MHVEAASADLSTPVSRAVWDGLCRPCKMLPPWLFYDDAGSALFERITRLPEYYPTRTERAIFASRGLELLSAAGALAGATLVELGAGVADKTQILLAQLAATERDVRYVPLDVSAAALALATSRLARELPGLAVRGEVARNEDAERILRGLPGRKVALFIGSSIGNYEEKEAVTLLRGVRAGLGPGDALVLGTDFRKDPAILVRAYDDASGVTAAFNRNVLVRLNRELGADFIPERFRHVALWNDQASRIEMHLESTARHTVTLRALGLRLTFRDGERIHTESSIKYDAARVDTLLGSAGLRRDQTFSDPQGWFGVHVARV